MGQGLLFAIEIVYLLLFLIYSDKERRLKVLLIVLVEVISIAVLTTLVLTLVHTTKKRIAIVGIGAIVFNTVMYALPLSIMKMVITAKSVEYMPFYFFLASFANGDTWSAYAFIKFDPSILAPNGTGTLFAVAQLILDAVYYRSTPRQITARQAKGDVGLSELVVNGSSKKTNSSRNGHGSRG